MFSDYVSPDVENGGRGPSKDGGRETNWETQAVIEEGGDGSWTKVTVVVVEMGRREQF